MSLKELRAIQKAVPCEKEVHFRITFHHVLSLSSVSEL